MDAVRRRVAGFQPAAEGRSRLWLLACELANLAGWIVLYSQFLRRFFYVPNPYAASLALLQVIPGLTATMLSIRRGALAAGRRRTAWLLLALALLFWSAADAILLFPETVPTAAASLAEHLLHLAAYGLGVAAIFWFAPAPAAAFERLRYRIDLLIQSASWGFLIWFLVVDPLLQPTLARPDTRLWVALYAMGDLVILMQLLWLQGQARRPLRAFWWLSGGMFFLSVYDLASGWFFLQAGENPFLWAGFLVLIGYGLISWSAIAPDETGAEGDSPADDPVDGRSRLRSRWQRAESRWLPMASTMALAVLVFNSWRMYGAVDPLLTWCTIGLCIFLVLREGVIAGQTELHGYAVLLNNISDPAFICRADGRLVLANAALVRSFSIHRRGDSIPDRVPISMQWDEILARARANGWEGELEASSSAGGRMPVWLVAHPLPREEGEQLRFACLIHDLTPQRKQEEALQLAYRQAEDARAGLQQLSENLEERVREQTADLAEALTRLEEQNRMLLSLDRMKSEFIALTSHELRTPLAGIRAGLELMLSQGSTVGGRSKSTLELVQQESERLSRFVESILDLTALEAGKLPLQVAPLAVNKPLVDARLALAAAHGGMDGDCMQRLRFEVPDGLPDVMADEHVLTSAVYQLVDNAFKYAPGAAVRVTARSAGTAVILTVADDGPGVAPGDRERLFVSFSRLESADSPSVRGAGLGLYLARKMVEAMGGGMELAQEESGFAVAIRLQAVRAEEA